MLIHNVMKEKWEWSILDHSVFVSIIFIFKYNIILMNTQVDKYRDVLHRQCAVPTQKA